MGNNKQRLIFLGGLVFLAALSRLIPHPYNFTAIGAVALFGGASFQKKELAFLIPLAAMFITDLFLGFHGNMWAVYLSFVLIAFLGIGMRSKRSVRQIFGRSLAGSVLFFLITNFAAWIGNPTYPQSFEGLMISYAMAVPFFENSIFGSLALNTIMGDLFFNGLLFGSLAFAERRFPKLQKVEA